MSAYEDAVTLLDAIKEYDPNAHITNFCVVVNVLGSIVNIDLVRNRIEFVENILFSEGTVNEDKNTIVNAFIRTHCPRWKTSSSCQNSSSCRPTTPIDKMKSILGIIRSTTAEDVFRWGIGSLPASYREMVEIDPLGYTTYPVHKDGRVTCALIRQYARSLL